MKEQRWINILIVITLILLVFAENPIRLGSVPMSVEFASDTGQYISFGAKSSLDNLNTMSVCAWVYPDTLPDVDAGFDFIVAKLSDDAAGWLLSLGDSTYYSKTNALLYSVNYSNPALSVGRWFSADNSISVGAWQHICVTIDKSNSANDPIMYVNGVSIAITEVETPSGTITSDSTSVVEVGGSVLGAHHSVDGKITDARIYNRILTPAEVLAIYEGRGRDNIINGLVFAPVLYGASGLQAYDGVVLGSGNKLVDPYSGAYGTPSGSPIGRAETYLSICP
jgi:hypothetical protein